MVTPLAHIPTHHLLSNRDVVTIEENSPPKDTSLDDAHCHDSADEHAPAMAWIETTPNGFSVFCSYPGCPTLDPEAGQSLDSVCDSPAFARLSTTPASLESQPTSASPLLEEAVLSSTKPFANRSSELLLGWHYLGSNLKSGGEFDRLVQTLLHPDFDLKELPGVLFARETKRLDKHIANPDDPLQGQDGWHHTSVDIHLPPVDKQTVNPENESPIFTVSGVFHRRLVNIIWATYASPVSHSFHMTLFCQFWHPTPDAPPISLYSEIYSSTAMIEAHSEISGMPCIGPDDTHERVVVPLMVWSDSTHLANFGTISLWPFYLQFSSQSKYTRGRPTSNSAHHLAYIPMVNNYPPAHNIYVTYCALPDP